MNRLSLSLIALLALGACSYAEGENTKMGVFGPLSDPACTGMTNPYSQGCHRGERGNLVKNESR